MSNIRELPNGSLVWKMGRMWGIIPPGDNNDYLNKNARYTPNKPNDTLIEPTGKGSLKRSFQIYGQPYKDIDTTIIIGWVKFHIVVVNGLISVNTIGGKEAADKRWSMGIPHYSRHKRLMQRVINPPYVNTGDFTSAQRLNHIRDTAYWEWLRSEIYIRDRGICWVCNGFSTLKDYQLGHLIDRSNGGNDVIDNCAVMHKQCNISKPRHKSLEEAATWRLKLVS